MDTPKLLKTIVSAHLEAEGTQITGAMQTPDYRNKSGGREV